MRCYVLWQRPMLKVLRLAQDYSLRHGVTRRHSATKSSKFCSFWMWKHRAFIKRVPRDDSRREPTTLESVWKTNHATQSPSFKRAEGTHVFGWSTRNEQLVPCWALGTMSLWLGQSWRRSWRLRWEVPRTYLWYEQRIGSWSSYWSYQWRPNSGISSSDDWMPMRRTEDSLTPFWLDYTNTDTHT